MSLSFRQGQLVKEAGGAGGRGEVALSSQKPHACSPCSLCAPTEVAHAAMRRMVPCGETRSWSQWVALLLILHLMTHFLPWSFPGREPGELHHSRPGQRKVKLICVPTWDRWGLSSDYAEIIGDVL